MEALVAFVLGGLGGMILVGVIRMIRTMIKEIK